MESNKNWLNVNYPSNDIMYGTPYVKVVKLSDKKAVEDLIKGVEGFNLFSKPANFLTNLVVFPFNVITSEALQVLPYMRVGINTGETTFNCSCANIEKPSQYIFNMGEFKVTPYFNNYLDYNGYTKISVYLPYCSEVEINTNDCMNKYLQFRLKIDLSTGSAIWIIATSKKSITPTKPPFANLIENDIDNVLGTYACNIGTVLPLGSTNAGDIKRNLLLGAVKVAGAVAMNSAFAGAGMLATTTLSNVKTTERNPATGRQITTGTTSTSKTTDMTNMSKVATGHQAFNSSISALESFHVTASCDKLNDPTLMSYVSQSVQVKIKRPKVVPQNYLFATLYGFPVGKVDFLYSYHGYTQLSQIDLSGEGFNSATKEETDLLKNLLLSDEGIYLPEKDIDA